MDTVSNAAVKDLVDTCLDLNELSIPVLEDLGVYVDTLENPELRCSEQLLIKIWQWLDEHSINHELGLEIGRVINESAKGLLASWVSQASTLGEALQIFCENIALMNPSESWKVTQNESHCILTFQLLQDKGYPQMAIDRSLAAMVTWGRVLCGQHFDITQAEFSFSSPNNIELYETLFGTNLVFNSNRNQLTIDRRVLEYPVVSSNQLLKRMMAKAVSDLQSSLTSGVSLKQRVTNEIALAWKRDGEISVEKICSALSLSRQTLFRKLKAEGCDFKALSDQFKKERALEMLQGGKHNITSVGLSLGYRDSSSFTKAFKRWYGTTPTSYLASQKGRS